MKANVTAIGLSLVCGLSIVSSQDTGDYRSVASGLWATALTWEVYNGSGWDAASAKPGASDNVFIQNGHTITLLGNEACKNLHVNTASAVLAVGTNTLELNGSLRAFSGAEDVIPGTSSTSPSSGCITTLSGGKVKMVGTARNIAEFDEWGPTTTDFDFEIALNSNQMAVMTTNLSAKSWNVISGNLNCGEYVISGSGNFTLGSGVTLIIGSPDGISSANPEGNIQVNGTRTYSTGANYDYVGVIDQVTGDGLPSSVQHCSLQSGVILTLTNPVTFNGSLQVISGTVADNGNQIAAGGSATLNVYADGTLRLGSNADVTVFPTFPNIILDPGSTVSYAGATASDQLVSTAPAYQNLRFYGGSKKIIEAGTLTVNEDLYVGSYVDLFTNNPTVNVAGDVDDGFGPSLNMGSGNVNVAGNWIATVGATGGPGAVVFTGSPSISQTSFENVTFNLSGSALLTGNVTVTGDLAFVNGNIFTGENILTLSGGVSGAGPGKCVVTDGELGRVFRFLGFGQGFSFPVGTATTYNPVSVSLNGGPDESFYVRVSPGIDPPVADNSTAVQRTWQIDEAGAPGNNVGLSFDWTAAEEGGSFDRDAASLWNGGGLVGSVFVSGTDPFQASIGITAFSNGSFIIGNTAGLPVQLSNFTASANRWNAELRWRTESEVENYGFEIERREMGQILTDTRTYESENEIHGTYSSPFTHHPSPWVSIGFVQGAGTSSSPKEYSFADEPGQPGRYAYRIKQIDHSGTFTYTSALEVVIGLAPLEFTLSQNYPNPFNPTTTIGFTIHRDGHVKLEVFDLQGRRVATLVDEERRSGVYHQVLFDASKLASGVYVAQLTIGEMLEARRMQLVR